MKFPSLKLSHNETVRIGKYLAGGSIYFWSGYGVFAIGYSLLHFWWLWAKVAADIIGWSLNYLAQRYWAFADQVHLSEITHLSRYLIIEAIGLVLDYLIIGGLRLIGISPYFGFFISAGFFSVWSYLWYKYWVFGD